MSDKTLLLLLLLLYSPGRPPELCFMCFRPWLQICPCSGCCRGVLGHELCDFADEVGLFGAAFAGLAPLLQDLLQVLHFKLFQVHCGQIELFVYRKRHNMTMNVKPL